MFSNRARYAKTSARGRLIVTTFVNFMRMLPAGRGAGPGAARALDGGQRPEDADRIHHSPWRGMPRTTHGGKPHVPRDREDRPRVLEPPLRRGSAAPHRRHRLDARRLRTGDGAKGGEEGL